MKITLYLVEQCFALISAIWCLSFMMFGVFEYDLRILNDFLSRKLGVCLVPIFLFILSYTVWAALYFGIKIGIGLSPQP